MSRKEAPRAGLVKAGLAGHITNAQGAQPLTLSVRQFQRLKARYRADGPRGLLHRSRGQPSPRRLAPALVEQVATRLQTTYPLQGGLPEVPLFHLHREHSFAFRVGGLGPEVTRATERVSPGIASALAAFLGPKSGLNAASSVGNAPCDVTRRRLPRSAAR